MLSGLLIGTSYIPFPPWALFFCLVPLFVWWSQSTDGKRAFWGGWLTQLILNVIGFHWVAHTAREFGHLPAPAAWATLVLFCSTAHLYYPIAGWAAGRLGRWRALGPEARILLSATLLLLLEAVLPVLFPWHLGYPWLWARWPGVQTADVIGFEGLNVATVAVNAAFAVAYVRRAKVGRALAWAGAGAALIAGLNLWGLARKSAWDATDAEIKVLAVQGNVGNYEKLYAQRGAAYQADILARYVGLTRKGLAAFPEADAVLWPETAFADNLDRHHQDRPNPRALRAFVVATGKTLFTGAYSEDVKREHYYNGFFAIGPDGQLVGDGYRKTILLAFGEYFPGSDLVPWIFDLIPSISSFGRGKGPMVMPAAGVKIGPQICYEGLYPSFSAELAKAGAEVILNVTNDSWFGRDFEPRQHLFMTLARALEVRRPLLRSTNTGITTAILANGEILAQSPQDEEWFDLFRLRYRRHPEATIYQKIEGFWPWALALTAALLLVFAHARKSRS